MATFWRNLTPWWGLLWLSVLFTFHDMCSQFSIYSLLAENIAKNSQVWSVVAPTATAVSVFLLSIGFTRIQASRTNRRSQLSTTRLLIEDLEILKFSMSDTLGPRLNIYLGMIPNIERDWQKGPSTNPNLFETKTYENMDTVLRQANIKLSRDNYLKNSLLVNVADLPNDLRVNVLHTYFQYDMILKRVASTDQILSRPRNFQSEALKDLCIGCLDELNKVTEMAVNQTEVVLEMLKEFEQRF